MLKKYYLLLTLLAAALFCWPDLHYQYILSQEDHGRDLYTFAQVAHGKHVYKDMWWVYGPLMPSYYALFDNLFGLKISSVLLGESLLKILSCLFFYLASCELMSAPWAFLSACFFMQNQEDFFYTYNHTAGIALFLMLLWLILRYIRQGDSKNYFWALGACLTIGFIKINFGVSALLATILSILIIEAFSSYKNKKSLAEKFTARYIGSPLLVLFLWISIYYILLGGLTLTEINQCLPYFGSNKPPIVPPMQSINGYWNHLWINFLKDWLSFLDALILLTQSPLELLNPLKSLTSSIVILRFLIYPLIYASIIAAYCLSFTKKFKGKRQEFWLIQLILGIFFIFNFHEYLLSNTWYRSFWSQPFTLFFFFFMISTAVSYAQKEFRYLVGGILISLFVLLTLNGWINTKKASTPDRFLRAASGQIYVGNDPAWVDTINTVTAYLNKNLKKNELFLALPCDSLFYYLTDKPSPSRQTIFFNFLHITPAQELSIIQELKTNKVNYILLSNRSKTNTPELGEFGKTYCPLIYKYVMENFTAVYRYGCSWNALPGWANNHAVIILKKKQP